MGSGLDFTSYARGPYRQELARFLEALGEGEAASALRGTRMRQPVDVWVPAGGQVRMRELLSEAKPRSDCRFVATLFLEGTLLAGVHCYDRGNYDRYKESTRVAILLDGAISNGLAYPYSVLRTVKDWTPYRLRVLTRACTELLPKWAKEYDRLIGRGGETRAGAGAKVVRELAKDRSLHWADGVSSAVRDAYLRGFAVAAVRLGSGRR